MIFFAFLYIVYIFQSECFGPRRISCVHAGSSLTFRIHAGLASVRQQYNIHAGSFPLALLAGSRLLQGTTHGPCTCPNPRRIQRKAYMNGSPQDLISFYSPKPGAHTIYIQVYTNILLGSMFGPACSSAPQGLLRGCLLRAHCRHENMSKNGSTSNIIAITFLFYRHIYSEATCTK